ncbi:hypothetical protein [Streptomyces novaecaesareae]|uniref:hypothetical protein n=1 Tax=Streptomyces novaecaesareae TaxID=68244 RepID=UPI0004AAEA59|nr:hypothetical protein [Streptomyces novaecaesareae]
MTALPSTPTTPVISDAQPAPRELMTLPGLHRDVRRWRLVEIRLDGQWRPALLSVWRRPPSSTRWVVHVRWGPDGPGPGEENWGWFLYEDTAIRPLPEPAAPAPGAARLQEAVIVPIEMTGAPDPDDAGRCWHLAWLRTGGQWRSASSPNSAVLAPGCHGSPTCAGARTGRQPG